MTYQNDFEINFKYGDKEYTTSADVTVELSRQDIGPIGYRDHVERFATDSVEVENLRVWESPAGEDIVPLPDDLKDKAESVLSEKASERAEEFLADE